MPELKRWVQFLSIAGLTMLGGSLFVKYGTPNDDNFLETLSPELRARYEKEKLIRERADQIMQRKIIESKNKPAWLQGVSAMRKLDYEIAKEARKSIEESENSQVIESERQRLKTLAAKESSMK